MGINTAVIDRTITAHRRTESATRHWWAAAQHPSRARQLNLAPT